MKIDPLLAIAMTTAPRREPTLPRALSSLREAGFDEEVHVFAEPGALEDERAKYPISDGIVLHANTARHGCFNNWRQAIGHLLACTTAPWLLVVQDDAIWTPGAAEILRAETRARRTLPTGFLSPYVTDFDAPPGHVDGWNACRSGWYFCGALALCVQREGAELLLRSPRVVRHVGTEQVDAVVAASMLDLGRPSFVHVPSLVNHVGATSTLGHDDRSATLRGYRFSET